MENMVSSSNLLHLDLGCEKFSTYILPRLDKKHQLWTSEQWKVEPNFLFSSICHPQNGCFFGKGPKEGRGIISDPKNDFGPKFWKKCLKGGGVFNPKKLCIFTKENTMNNSKTKVEAGQRSFRFFQT